MASDTVCGEVLIVEDDSAIRRLLDVTLRHEGIAVTTAADGMEAVEVLSKKRFRVMVLDLMMPRMSGWEVIDCLKEGRCDKPGSVVVVSAADRGVLAQLDPSVVNAIVFKPFDVRELAGYIHACCTAPIEKDRRVKRIVGNQA